MRRTKLNTQVSEEAAHWFVEFRLGQLDGTARQEFDDWMRASPEHLRAYLEIAAIWNEGHLLDRTRKLDVEALTARALAEGNVVSLESDDKASVPELAGSSHANTDLTARSPKNRSARGRYFAIAASFATALLIGMLLAGWQFFRFPTYSTDIGEQRSVQLSDGSMIELNARSKIKIRFSDETRTIQLLRGQALFRVAKDPGRPFIVESDQDRVRAVGTQFDVHRKRAATIITVLEGEVAISSPLLQSPVPASHTNNVPPTSHLEAGEQLTLAPEAPAKPVRANVAAATAWTRHQLIFESATLEQIVEEVNRYSVRPFSVEDSTGKDLRLSGVFSSTNLEFLVRFLSERPEITVEQTKQEVRIIRH